MVGWSGIWENILYFITDKCEWVFGEDEVLASFYNHREIFNWMSDRTGSHVTILLEIPLPMCQAHRGFILQSSDSRLQTQILIGHAADSLLRHLRLSSPPLFSAFRPHLRLGSGTYHPLTWNIFRYRNPRSCVDLGFWFVS